MATISVVIFGKNDEQYIERLFKSVKPFANEILYLNNGSTDKTLNIVKKYTNNIFHDNGYRNNAKFRNFLNSKVKSKWTLFMDTDELVTKEFTNKIKDLLNWIDTKPTIHHIYFKCVNLIYDEKHMLTTQDFHPFLFHPKLALKEYANWFGERHENYIGKGNGFFWDIFAVVHYNLLLVDRLKEKLVNEKGFYGEYVDKTEKYDYTVSNDQVLRKFIGKSDIVKVPENILW